MINFAINKGSIKSTDLENKSLDLKELTKLLTAPVITSDKLNAGYFLRCTGTKRSDKTVDDVASLLILDGDKRLCHDGIEWNGAINPHLIHNLFKGEGINHVIYTSHSNDVDLHKYRFVIPVQYHRNQLDAMLWHIFGMLHENELMLVDVKENHSYAQAWFFHSCPVDKTHLAKTYAFGSGDDGALNVEQITADYQKHLAWLESIEPPARIFTQSQAPNVVGYTPSIVLTGQINPIEVFNQSYSIHEILIANGYKPEGNKRYLHQNSQSGIAGTRILENGKVYSDSNDALNDGYAHDAFDCFMLLNCNGDRRAALNWNPEITKHNQRIYAETKTEKPQQSLTVTASNSVKINPTLAPGRALVANQ